MNKIVLFLVLGLLSVSCKSDKKNSKKETVAEKGEMNTATDDWVFLFDGSSTKGWRAYNGDSLPPQWVIVDGVLTFDTERKLESERKGGNDIIYAAEAFDNFELYWEWKIPEGGNSGLLYHIQEGDWSPPEVSPEYQMLDDLKWEVINNATLEDWQKTGADYAMYAPDKSQKIVKPAGAWNSSRIKFTPEEVEHWLNGKKIVSFVPWTTDWEKRKADGKWKDFPMYGTFKKGYIGFQDHDSPLWLRNVKIRKL
ncbi:DUF1080 domain-containing protein [Aggregatimonas sangjinii]|uniref:DUF1080 domain-containing protein n=1 Tax=Aggregatimonas sangjinii TaxID=2583587 RepID=A0A5B7SS41_9FLAO|nr:DUF1080 domain-containing protein [Aggregatimonas sangjinii]QCX01022.1 DUF1080 domain-containing protein [Aggregatimonas sangjinii]